MKEHKKSKVATGFLLIPLIVVLSIATSVVTYVSYDKFVTSNTNLLGLTYKSSFFENMQTLEEIFDNTDHDIAKFKNRILRIDDLSAWVLRPVDNELLVIASSKYPELIGKNFPNYICQMNESLNTLTEFDRFSNVKFQDGSMVKICDFKMVNSTIIGYDSVQNYRILGFDDPNFFKWYWGNMGLVIYITLIALSVYVAIYCFLYYKIADIQNTLENANFKLTENTKKMTMSYYFNSLTKIPNCNSLLKDIEQMTNPVVIIIDIDNFSSMNNYFGTRVCDQILIYLAKFNTKLAEKNGLKLYHIDADAFAFVENSEHFIDRYEELVVELMSTLKGLVVDVPRLEGEKEDLIEIHCTIGFALEPENTLKKAMLALQYAKKNKRDYFGYLRNIDDTVAYAEQIKRSNLIRDAIINDNITPYYQPIFDVNKAVVKYETLMRIQDSNTIVSPGDFLEISKRIKRYVEMEKMVIEKSFKLVSETKDCVISINVSTRDMTDGDVSVFIMDRLHKYQIADRVIFEVLEDEDIDNVDRVMKFIERVRRMGSKVAIDDFGSGYSNFSNILKLKPDFIKIDGSIIKNVVSDLNSRYIATAIVAFCKKLNIKVVAEYVENQEIFDTCVELGVDEFQGFYLGKPAAAFVENNGFKNERY
ncbi:MAG: EAL domain-containing protein [Campylobacter sp.]